MTVKKYHPERFVVERYASRKISWVESVYHVTMQMSRYVR